MSVSLADKIHSINNYQVHVFRTGRWKQNSYLVFNTLDSSIILIDPGGEAEKIIQTVEALEGTVESICLTHAHHDHVGALKSVCEKFGKEFYIHKNDLKLLRRAPMFALTFEARKMEVPQLGQVFLSDARKEVITKNIKFMHTPGHTTGGVVIYIENLAFTGDTLLNKMVGRTDLPGASTHELESSISYFLYELTDETTLFPGHGDPWQVAEAKTWWEANKHCVPEYRTDNELSY